MNKYTQESLCCNAETVTASSSVLKMKIGNKNVDITEDKTHRILTIKSDFMFLLIDVSDEPNFSTLDESEFGENVCVNGSNSKYARIRDGVTGRFISKKRILFEAEECLSVGMGDSIDIQPWSSLLEKDTESDSYGAPTDEQLEAFNTLFIDYLVSKCNDLTPMDFNQENVVNDVEQSLLDQLIEKAVARLLLKFKQGRFAVHALQSDSSKRAKPDVEHLIYLRGIKLDRHWYPNKKELRDVTAWYEDAMYFDLDAAIVVEMTNILNEANRLKCDIEDIMQAEADELYKENIENKRRRW